VEFPIRLQPGLWPILLLFGVVPGAATVRLDRERLTARFGFFRTEAALANIVGWDITGPLSLVERRWGQANARDARTCPSVEVRTAVSADKRFRRRSCSSWNDRLRDRPGNPDESADARTNH
jgi:hypothetical protein